MKKHDSDYEIRLATLGAMGGDTTKEYDSVYEIDLEILKLTEEGGSGKAIETVDALPEASENKDKLFRLSSDDNVYVSELKSRTSTTTNRLPDAQQIDKACIWFDEGTWFYKGLFEGTFGDGKHNVFVWYSDDESDLIITKISAENSDDLTEKGQLLLDELTVDLDNKTFTTTENYTDIDWFSIEDGEPIHSVIATYNASEENCIGNAMMYADSTLDSDYVYTGEFDTVGDFSGYVWKNPEDDSDIVLTDKKASEISFYYDADYNDAVFLNSIIYIVNNEEEVYGRIGAGDCLYIPQLNAPEEQQIDNAFISYPEDETISYTYGGVKTFNCTDGTLDLYEWEKDGYRLFTRIPASDLYEHAYEIPEETITDVYTVDWSTYDIEATVAELQTLLDNTSCDDWNCTTEKYTREEVIEEWDWQPLTDNATNDDIDLMFASEIKLIRYQDAEQQAEGFVDWWINTSVETMEYDGQTYYKWVSWSNDKSEGGDDPVEHPDYILLTNTLNIALPFNSDSPEFEYTISYDSEGDIWSDTNYFHGDYTQKTVQ